MPTEPTDPQRVEQLDALAHPQRLALFRLLVRRYPDEVPAGELAQALEVRQNTLSSYLSSLRHAGLIEQTRMGRSLLYRVRMDQTGGLMSYLFADCCRGRPELCPPSASETARSEPKYNVLFVCAGNSARSLFAESILRTEGGDRFNAHSAGTQPRSTPHPLAIELLADRGHDIAPLRSKTVAAFRATDAPAMDFVFTVCDRAANEECPAWPDQPLTAHWGVPDPVAVTGPDPERRRAFADAYAALERRIQGLVDLPIETLDRASLQRRLDTLALTQEPQ
ncbi:metalloregulator ArsR/SmtB family transcription factor [Tranquillimonas rosea]|uniref:metalloregulator ArsR/SmtB family transcription factor n=1 Tax=Tranquillimonas rosea TaxID=641238 RepID=UPI003BAB98ED